MVTATRWQNRIISHGEAAPGELMAHPLNPKLHPINQELALDGIIESVGMIAPVIVNQRTGVIVDGHLRVKLALSRGEPSVPVTYVDLTDEQEAMALLTFDPIAAQAKVDAANLDTLLRQVETDNDALQQMLTQQAEAAGLTFGEQAAPIDAPEPELDRADELQTKWNTERGQLWTIGRHRLLCGDSTNADDVARLMDGKKADMVFADPPYGISIVAANGFVGGGEAYHIPFGGVKNRKGLGEVSAIVKLEASKYLPIKGDDTTATATVAYALAATLYPKAVHIWWGCNYYADSLPPSPCWLVWDKQNNGNFADCELAWTNQSSAVRIFRHMWNGMVRDSERGKRVHPTQKPAALAVWAYERYGAEDDIILDPFAGSGMAMAAAEQLNRSCYAIEYEPAYCAVILERMAAMGLSPLLVSA